MISSLASLRVVVSAEEDDDGARCAEAWRDLPWGDRRCVGHGLYLMDGQSNVEEGSDLIDGALAGGVD